MTSRAAAWSVALATATIVVAPASARDSVRPLMDLAGEWAGEGWIDMGKGRIAFRQTERIVPRLHGTILTIEGTGRDPANPETVTFEAFAVLSATGKPGQYDMRSYTRDGRVGTFPAVLEAPGKLVWTIPVPGRQVRYRVDVAGDRWTETGEASADGGVTWLPFFDMTLTRVPTKASRAP